MAFISSTFPPAPKMDTCTLADLFLDRFCLERKCKEQMHLQIYVGEVWKYVLIFIEDRVVLMWSLSTPDEPGTHSHVCLMPRTCANKHLRISELRVGQNFHLIQ